MTQQPKRITRQDPSSWDTFDLIHLIPPKGGLCLDLGCGPGAKAVLHGLGFDYIGLDRYPSPGADVLSMAEKLPFNSNSFDLVIAASSFEHFPDPWAAAKEIERVLKPSGCLIASLSFLEPYHARSHFHMSHLGAHKLFTESGLLVEVVEPFEWTGFEAGAQALFQFPPARWLTKAIIRPTLWLRRFIIKSIIWKLEPGPRRERAIEFLNEEKFRFTAGIKIRAKKTY